MKRLLIAVALFLPTALHAQSYQPREVGGWRIAPMEDEEGSCFISLEYEGDGSTELFLTLDPTGKTFLLIRNDNWSIKAKEELRLNFSLSMGDYSDHTVIGTENRGFITTFEPKFIDYFAKSTYLEIDRDGQLIDSLKLKGSGAAVLELKRCVATIKRASEAMTKERKRLEHIPSDPFARP